MEDSFYSFFEFNSISYVNFYVDQYYNNNTVITSRSWKFSTKFTFFYFSYLLFIFFIIYHSIASALKDEFSGIKKSSLSCSFSFSRSGDFRKIANFESHLIISNDEFDMNQNNASSNDTFGWDSLTARLGSPWNY